MAEEWRSLEKRVTKLETEMAVTDERYKHIDKNLNELNGLVRKLSWLIVSVVILAVMASVMTGVVSIG